MYLPKYKIAQISLLFSYMIVTHDTLINSWNFRGLDGSTVWHGNEHVRNIR